MGSKPIDVSFPVIVAEEVTIELLVEADTTDVLQELVAVELFGVTGMVLIVPDAELAHEVEEALLGIVAFSEVEPPLKELLNVVDDDDDDDDDDDETGEIGGEVGKELEDGTSDAESEDVAVDSSEQEVRLLVELAALLGEGRTETAVPEEVVENGAVVVGYEDV
ncbi:hypothetical protein L228DRAFT_236528 [Xylona heveae TC161]|uniref:Uncharacterized protein n=1 Tax=Xylona heveae (strain CBS 132557 / TC161) TaxID=1328760 RepID=A0A165IV01_XYLHT|nr:hypothetical protein L228DRAFT_236528 [Xylona heveae TC161]KZF25428.1 hypothetical protein L228DRAFT_236528 [Xylona heveae TC161]